MTAVADGSETELAEAIENLRRGTTIRLDALEQGRVSPQTGRRLATIVRAVLARPDATVGRDLVAECPECGQDVPATLAPGLTVPADDTAAPDRDALRRIATARQLAHEAIDERARAATGKGRYTAQEYVEMDGAAALAEQILAALDGAETCRG